MAGEVDWEEGEIGIAGTVMPIRCHKCDALLGTLERGAMHVNPIYGRVLTIRRAGGRGYVAYMECFRCRRMTLCDSEAKPTRQ